VASRYKLALDNVGFFVPDWKVLQFPTATESIQLVIEILRFETTAGRSCYCYLCIYQLLPTIWAFFNLDIYLVTEESRYTIDINSEVI
jgi:hypothetical protein